MNVILILLLLVLCITFSAVHAINDELSLQNAASGAGLQNLAPEKMKGKKNKKKEPILCSLQNKGGWLNYCNGVESVCEYYACSIVLLPSIKFHLLTTSSNAQPIMSLMNLLLLLSLH